MNTKKQTALELLAELIELYPDMRLGQLVTNVSQWARGPEVSATWDVTDDEFIQAARASIERNAAK